MNDFLAFLSRKDVKDFIRENLESNVQDLLLNPPKAFPENIRQIAEQILSRQKIKKKLPTWYKDLDVIMPPPLSAEQASSLATCQYKAGLVKKSGTTFTDLTGGMGVDCFYLSKGFEDVTYVESNEQLCDIFQYNAAHFDRNIRVVHTTATEFLKSQHLQNKQTLYVDPDRRTDAKNRVFKIEDCSPDLNQILPLVKGAEVRMLVKYSPLLDLSAIIEAFQPLSAIHVISVKNECKEILVDIHESDLREPTIHCVNLETSQPNFSFSFFEEKSSDPELSAIQGLIYEPNASIMKAGAFTSVGLRYGLKKLARNTHLYTNDKELLDFPGRVFRVLEKVTKSSLKQYAPDGKINVMARNHPLTTQKIKSKWKVKDGGDYFMIAFRNQLNQPQMVIAEKVR